MSAKQKLSLKTYLDPSFLSLVLGFAEESVRVFGFDARSSAQLRLASEEVFLYLCRAGKTGKPITVEVENHVYFVKVKFLFEALQFDPHALNFTARNALHGDEDDLGLVIASRSVNRFYILHDMRPGMGLVLTKEKVYPEATGQAEAGEPLPNFTCRKPDPEMVKRFVHRLVQHYDAFSFPSDYRYPGKVVDMVESGDHHVLVATGTGKHEWQVGGAICWHVVGRGMIEFFGPYVFDQPRGDQIATALVDRFIGDVGKGEAPFVVSRYTTPELPRGHFELLGSVEYRFPSGVARACPFYYRQLKEDLGHQVWADQALRPFLDREYHRLTLPREILSAGWEGEKRSAHSVFAVAFDREQNSVTLSPVWEGEDGSRNLADHVKVLTAEGVTNIFFELDLGQPWQAGLTPALFKNRFTPVLLVPCAGKGDVVVFRYV